MRRLLLLLLLLFLPGSVLAQTDGVGGTFGMGGAFTLGAPNPNACGIVGFPQLPTTWAVSRDARTVCSSFAVTKTLGIDYPATMAGINQAVTDWCTSGLDQCEVLNIPKASFNTTTPFATTSRLALCGKPAATKYFVFKGDGPITNDQIPCSHKFVDNNDGTSSRDLSCTHDSANFATLEGQWNSGNTGMIADACTIGDPNCAVGPNHYVFENLELRFQAGNAYTGAVKLFNFNDGDLSGLLGPSDIWFLQDYLHADATESGTASNKVATIVDWTGCRRCGAIDFYVDKVVQPNGESHIFTASWSPGPLKFAQGWLEGSSIPILFGGLASTAFPYENVYDVEIRNIRSTKSPQWKNLPGSSLIAEKSGGEFKTCTRCLVDGFISENNNTTGGQKGQGWTLTVRNTSGGNGGDNYANDISNVTLSNFWMRHNVTGFETAPRSSSLGNGGGSAQPGHDWLFYNGLFSDIAPGSSTLTNTTVTFPFIVEMGAGGNNWTATNAVRDPTGSFTTLTLADGGTGLHQTTMSAGDLVHVQGCTDTTFNTPLHNATFFGEGPHALPGTLSYIQSAIGAADGTISSGAAVLTSASNPFTLAMVGEIITVAGAGPSGAPLVTQILTFTSAGNVTLNANASTSVTTAVMTLPVPGPVVYPNAGTPNATSAGCLVFNNQGFPKNLTARHLTVVGGFSGSSGGVGYVPSCLAIDGYSLGFNFSDNLIVPLPGHYGGALCRGDGNTEGSVSEANMADTASLTWSRNVFGPTAAGTARSNALYTDWPGAVTPSVSNWFPKNVVCPNATADADCVGLVGMMSGAPYDANDPLINTYGLVPSSLYAAGGARQASDGKNVGAVISEIQSHFAATQFQCPNPGGTGPNPD